MSKLYGFRALPRKVIAALVVIACVVIGVVGIVLPVIPGLVFLAFAALVAARNVPWLDARLRTHHSIGPRMPAVDRFFRLPVLDQLRVTLLMGVKCTLDGLDRISAWIGRRMAASRGGSF
jgi:uncharacterized membrane protein YbaN (DUF454 family)